MQILLSRSPAGPGRTGKQEEEQISPNHVQAFFPSSVYCYTHPREQEAVVGEEVEDGVDGVVARAARGDVAARADRVELAVGVELAPAEVPRAVEEQAAGASDVVRLLDRDGK